jgi:hypothetical protein
MKTILLGLIGVLIFALPGTPLSASAQTALQARGRASDQWVSHQMNQPPPDSGSKHQLSDAMIDEIRQLLQQSEKDLAGTAERKKTTP